MSKKSDHHVPGKGHKDDTRKSYVTVMDKSGVRRRVAVTRPKKLNVAASTDNLDDHAPKEHKQVKAEPPTHHTHKHTAIKEVPSTSEVKAESKPNQHIAVKRHNHPKFEEPGYSIFHPSQPTITEAPESKTALRKAESKKKRKKVQKGTYKKFFNLSALDAEELEENGSSVTESDSSGIHQGEEDENHPDMNWFSKDDGQYSEAKVNEEGGRNKEKTANNIKCKKVLNPYLWTCLVLGRLPFKFSVDKKTGIQTCRMPRKSLSFVIFVLTTIIMAASLLKIFHSIMSLQSSKIDKTDDKIKSHYMRLELLLINNWWLPISILIFSLFMVVVGSFSVIVSGPSMAAYITLWLNTMTHFNTVGYTIHTKTLRFIAWAHPISTGLNLIIILTLCYTKTFTFHEPIQTITLLLFRDFKDHLYFDLVNKDIGKVINKDSTSTAKNLTMATYLVGVFMVYVFFCARSFLIIIIIFCRGIAYLAIQWNIRLAIILRKLSPERVGLEKMKPQKYEDMLSDHQKIVVLISGISRTFPTVIAMFALVECFKLIAAMFATSQDLVISTHKFNSTNVEYTEVRYQKEIQDEWGQIVYHLSHTIISFGLVSWGVTSAGDMVMAGFDTVRRHGLLLANGVKERKFIMSLIMSFNAASPHVICPGNWFLFNRGFIMSVFCGAMTIYTLLIQLTIVHKVDVPIVFTCAERKGNAKLCFGQVTENFVGGMQEEDKEKVLDDVAKVVNVKEFNDAFKGTSLLPISTTSPTNPDTDKRAKFPWLIDEEGFLPETIPANEVEEEFERRCIRYCKGSLIRRPVAYNVDGTRYKPLPNEMSLDKCILNPYKDIMDTPGVTEIYNCRKIKSSVKQPDLDDCTQPGISRDAGKSLETKTNYIIKNSDKNFTCFEEITNKHANPLESCHAPFTALADMPCLSKGTARRLLFGVWAFNSTKPEEDVQPGPALCDAGQMSSDPTQPDSYEVKNGIVQKFTIEFINGEIRTLWKMTGFSLRSIRHHPPAFTTHAIPLAGSPEDKLSRPYAYIHPKEMYKLRGGQLLEYSYGYYDCFGEPLLKFDECGNLPFSLVINGAHVKQTTTTPVTTEGGQGQTYQCYTSPIPNYKCGVPPDLVDKACGLWQTYYNDKSLLRD